jgi:DNA-binding transcriptional ArsR family regulator
VSALADICEVTVTAVGQHLRILEEAGLVTSSKLGRVRSCQLDPTGLAVLQRWLAARRSIWEKRLDAFGAVLARQGETNDKRNIR